MLAITEANVAKLDAGMRWSGQDQESEESSIKILLVDGHFLIRKALLDTVKRLKNHAIILEAADSRQMLRIMSEHTDFSHIFLELNLPDRDGIAVLSELRELYPGTSTVVVSARHDRNSVAQALDLGAVGFIPKSARHEILHGALEIVFAGGIYIPPEILARDQTSLRVPDGTQPAAGPQPLTPAELSLTGRQLDVLQLMMQGKSNKAIGRVLKLAEPTVKNHVTAILKACKATNRTEAVIAARKLCWDQPQARRRVDSVLA